MDTLNTTGLRFDHIGFLSADVDRDMAVFSSLLGVMTWSEKIVDPLQDVAARFGRGKDGLTYELIEPLSATSPIAQNLKARKNILNHVCYRCENLTEKAAELREQGFFPVTEPKPGTAFGGALIQFFYQPNGLFLELIEGLGGPFDALRTGPQE